MRVPAPTLLPQYTEHFGPAGVSVRLRAVAELESEKLVVGERVGSEFIAAIIFPDPGLDDFIELLIVFEVPALHQMVVDDLPRVVFEIFPPGRNFWKVGTAKIKVPVLALDF